jgi:iron complex outermembrane recepter protein
MANTGETPMNRLNSGIRVLVCTALLAVTSTAAMAAVPAAASDELATLQEVIVTAQKREEKLQDVPIPITVISAKQLADQHVYTIADLARTAPALEMIQAFGGPGGGGQIRGIGTTSFTRSAEGAVGIVVDGVPQGNANASNIFDMQQVEVLRGPQGTLFGLTSSAGVINMTTIAPDPTKFEVKMHIDYSDKGTSGSRFGQQTLRGVMNVPLSGASALRVSANADVVKGVQRNAFTRLDNQRTDAGVRVRYRWNESERLDVNLIADYSHFTANYADPQFTYVIVPAGPLVGELAGCGITASFANQSRCSNQSNKSSGKNLGFSAQFDWQLANVTLTSITGYRKNDAGPDDVDIMSTPAEFTQIFGTGDLSSRRQISQEVRIASPAAQKLEYTAGLFYSDYVGTSDRAPGGAFNVGTFQLAPVFINFVKAANSTRTTNKASAVFGQLSYHGTDKLTFLAGARFTSQKITDSSSANRFDAMSSATVPISLSKTNVSAKLGLQYKFVANLTGYATATRGYKGPQVQSAAQGSPATVINAEIPTAYELGLKGTVLNGRLGIDANVFQTSVTDYQGQRCGINAVGILVCSPESVDVDTKGFELSLNAQPARGLALNGGFIYNVARYPNGWTGYNPNDLRNPVRVNGIVTLGPGTTSLSREQLVGSPKTKFTFAADYSHALGSIEGFVNVDTVHKSDLRLGPSGDSRFIYPAHWTTGTRLGVRATDGRWSVSLFARNIGDEHEPATLFGGPSFLPPGVVPFLPNGQVNGISGWMTQNSLRQVGLSFDLKY